MIDPVNYRTVYLQESARSIGSLGIRIDIAGTALPKNVDTQAINSALYAAADGVIAELIAARDEQDPQMLEAVVREKFELLACFGSAPIFVEAIPNGYDSSAHSRLRKWFVVTTSVGHFTIGWRKRVIHLDWSRTVGTRSAEELFPDENVTKGDKYIHAWSLEKATEYVKTIMVGDYC